jgi:hypothetical protein
MRQFGRVSEQFWQDWLVALKKNPGTHGEHVPLARKGTPLLHDRHCRVNA